MKLIQCSCQATEWVGGWEVGGGWGGGGEVMNECLTEIILWERRIIPEVISSRPSVVD